MTLRIATLPPPVRDDAPGRGPGALRTERGNLPLRGLEYRTEVSGLAATTVLTQRFHNPHDEAIEAVYVFPVPERAAVTGMVLSVADREVSAELRERGQARADYARAVSEGRRAAIAEAERADVFTMRVGNIPAGEEATVRLTMVGPLALVDGQATLRLPLVVAPRYIPGTPLDGPSAGDGHAPDTDAVPDASRITPPVLLPGAPDPVALAIGVTIDPGGLPLTGLASSLHGIVTEESQGRTVVRVEPGERVNRDFILRFDYGEDGTVTDAVTVAPDEDGEGGTVRITLVPPRHTDAGRPKDVVVLLDRSGSMNGWKMVAARRAAARIVDTLSDADRFAVRCFDHVITAPDDLGDGLVAATDRNRYRAVEHLGRADARGGTELLGPLRAAADLLSPAPDRDRVVILVTDGQVGNEDQILAAVSDRLAGARIHVVGIDRAVNAGFLYRLALLGRGRCELVESEDRLDAATAHIHRRIVAPVVTDLKVEASEGALTDLAPARITDLFTGVPVVWHGRYRGAAPSLTVSGVDADGRPWRVTPERAETDDTLLRRSWARDRIRDLEDEYVSASAGGDIDSLEKSIVDVSLDNGVMSRFTAFVAVDVERVTGGGEPRRVVQPVELPDGWQAPPPMAAAPMAPAAAVMRGGPPPAPAGGGMQAMTFGAPAPQAARGFGRAPAVLRGGSAPSRSARRSAPPADTLVPALRQEVSLLTESPATGGERARRAELSDLASRLGPIVTALAGDGALPDDLRERCDRLTAALGRCDGPNPPAGTELEALAREAVAVLRALIDALERPSGDAGGTGDAPRATRPARGAFWKRRR
ncbi:Ca-activated chloride channel family protein [Stackebrandtia albiflava]|uniref:Ca-activated chloride channel family protein n=1 Tax=Stackebrandtia albiflava TaxID=406432 RepID=A0A562VEC3_9ACTN|nr:VIT domain-containing protein [Stackebrandtia albiflava]TWJ16194.1 Ca-activated chloride channel family protein [Stackebrandtia albiflava]